MSKSIDPRTDACSESTPECEPTDERALIDALRAGSPAAFESLVRLHAPRMRALALRYLGCEHMADDAVQDAFLAAFRALERFELRSKLSTWLHRITANVALMMIRARRSESESTLDDRSSEFSSYGVFRAPVAAWRDESQDALVQEETSERVRQFIARLPDKHRIPLMMREIEGLQHDEIARALGISVNASKIRVHRARLALRESLNPLMAGELS